MTRLQINLVQMLKTKNLSLTKLSKISGVPKTNLHAWTTGSNPNLKQLKLVSEVLKVSVVELAFGEYEELTYTSHNKIKTCNILQEMVN